MLLQMSMMQKIGSLAGSWQVAWILPLTFFLFAGCSDAQPTSNAEAAQEGRADFAGRGRLVFCIAHQIRYIGNLATAQRELLRMSTCTMEGAHLLVQRRLTVVLHCMKLQSSIPQVIFKLSDVPSAASSHSD